MNKNTVDFLDNIFHIKNSVDALDMLLSSTVSRGASDLHIDPREDHVMVRIRVDGIVMELCRLNIDVHESLISRLKILAGVRIDVHDFPQDGRFNTKILDANYNVRISFMPTFFGENAVLRILAMQSTECIPLSDLGFSLEHCTSISKAIKKSGGMILVTGPTGSGKTTTLYTCLSEKTKEDISVISLEDPIEYEIQNVRQIHVRQNQGVTFANVLKSVLRQDPDVVMIGEIRDSETANLAMHTALTGHLVFSTLHTNSAVETITRLVGMGIESYVIASTLKLVVSQRLVRNACRLCSGIGCDKCLMAGYIGRTVISEVLEIDEKLKNMISGSRDMNTINNYLSQIGWKSIEDDATEKVDWGITTNEEVYRVLGK